MTTLDTHATEAYPEAILKARKTGLQKRMNCQENKFTVSLSTFVIVNVGEREFLLCTRKYLVSVQIRVKKVIFFLGRNQKVVVRRGGSVYICVV